MTLYLEKNSTEEILREIITITGETQSEAIYQALLERRRRLVSRAPETIGIEAKAQRKHDVALAFLQNEVWPQIPPDVSGQPLTKQEKEAILGYGDIGV